MSEQRPYPEREHRDAPQTFATIMQEEMRLYGDTASFEQSIAGLSRLYGVSPLAKSFQIYARRLAFANSYVKSEDTRDCDYVFYAGTMFSLHCHVPLLGTEATKVIAGSAFYPQDVEVRQEDSRARALRDVAYHIDVYDELVNMVERQDEDVQYTVMEAAHLFCGDNSKRAAQEWNFAAGMMYTSGAIISISDQWLTDRAAQN